MTIEERCKVALETVADAVRGMIPDFRIETHLSIVGSTYYANKETSDVDVLVHYSANVLNLVFDDWEYGGSSPLAGDSWCSWKTMVKGVEINMLLAEDIGYTHKWLTAAEVCKYLHLRKFQLTKGDVAAIHEIIMDDGNANTEFNRRRSY